MTGFAALQILIVDDHEMMRSVLSRALHAAGAEHVRTAENGWQALALLAAQPADLIISDYSMPEMDGVDLIRRVRADARHTQARVVMLTGHMSTGAAARAAGADAVLIKPVTPKDLLATLETLLVD